MPYCAISDHLFLQKLQGPVSPSLRRIGTRERDHMGCRVLVKCRRWSRTGSVVEGALKTAGAVMITNPLYRAPSNAQPGRNAVLSFTLPGQQEYPCPRNYARIVLSPVYDSLES